MAAVSLPRDASCLEIEVYETVDTENRTRDRPLAKAAKLTLARVLRYRDLFVLELYCTWKRLTAASVTIIELRSSSLFTLVRTAERNRYYFLGNFRWGWWWWSRGALNQGSV